MRSKFYFISGMVVLLLSILFTGIYADDEFYDKGIFLKRSPTFKYYFYSPTGMSDLTLDDLTGERREEEAAFVRYVLQPGIQYPGDQFFWVPLLLIHLTLVLLFSALVEQMHHLKVSWSNLLWRLLAGSITTFFGIAYMLHADELVVYLLVSVLLVGVNYGATYYLAVRRQKN